MDCEKLQEADKGMFMTVEKAQSVSIALQTGGPEFHLYHPCLERQ